MNDSSSSSSLTTGQSSNSSSGGSDKILASTGEYFSRNDAWRRYTVPPALSTRLPSARHRSSCRFS